MGKRDYLGEQAGRISELEVEVERLRSEVRTLRSALPKPPVLADGEYRGVITEVTPKVSASGRNFVQVKIEDITGFPTNVLWANLMTRALPSKYEELCTGLGLPIHRGAAHFGPPPEEIADPSRLVGARVRASVTVKTWNGKRMNEVKWVGP